MEVIAWRSIFPSWSAVPEYVLKAYLLGRGAVPGVLVIFPVVPGVPFPVPGARGVPFPVSGLLSSSSESLFFKPFGLREVPPVVCLLSYEGFFFMMVVVGVV
jgi:hypothetical protein